MSNEESSEIAHGLALAMAQMAETIAPIEEAARGMRQDLIANKGWSPESADIMAREYYVVVMKSIQGNANKTTENDE